MYNTLRTMAQTSWLLEYRFSSQNAKKAKKIVALEISILWAVISFIFITGR
jgi:hypothetical protein